MDVTGENDDGAPRDGAAAGGPRLRVVQGPVAGDEPPPPVRLWREWKGPTVADLLRDEFAARLPGVVRTACRHIERGDLRAAEQALPGEFARVLAGPRRVRGSRRLAVALVALAAVAAAAALAKWVGA